MKRLSVLLLLLAQLTQVKAQFLSEFGHSFTHKPRFFFNFTQYNSFISHETANVSGIRAGLEFNKKVRLGVGYSWLYSEIVDHIGVNPGDDSYQTNGELKFRYVNTMVEYELYDKFPWQIAVPMQIGVGNSYYEYLDRTTKERLTTPKFMVVLAEPSLTAQYSIFDWVAVAGGLGFRVALNSTKDFKKDFNSPIYVLKLKFSFDEIMKDVFPEGNPLQKKS